MAGAPRFYPKRKMIASSEDAFRQVRIEEAAPQLYVDDELSDVDDDISGVSDDISDVDAKLDDVSHSEPTRALDTVYQNTTDKIKFVSVTIFVSDEQANVLIGSSSSPSTVVAVLKDIDSLNSYRTASFIVPVDWYYEIESTIGTPIKIEWHEWDLH